MKKFALLLLVFSTSLGCGSGEPAVNMNQDGPFSVEEWKAMDVLVKYELETFERLQESDPKLKQKQRWNQFMKDVVIPEREKDIPSSY